MTAAVKRRRVSLGALGTYVNGMAFKPTDWQKVGLPIIRIANLTDPRAPVDYFSGVARPECLVSDGDVLVSWSATLDAFVWSRGPAVVNQHIFRAVPRDGVVDRSYFHLLLKHSMRALSALVHGSTMKHVTRPDFESFEVNVIDRASQSTFATKLVNALEHANASSVGVDAQLSDLLALEQRVLQVAFDGIGAAPRVTLSSGARTGSGTTPDRGQSSFWTPPAISWVKTGEVAFAPITSTEEAVSHLALVSTSLTLLPVGSVLIAMYGQGKTRGQSAVLKIEATCNQACFAIWPNDTWRPEFLQLWLQRNYRELRALSESRGGNQANLNGALLNAFEAPVIPLDDQDRFVGRLQAQLAELKHLQANLQAQRRDIDLLPSRLLAEAFA